MRHADVPASKIYTVQDIVADAHYQARAMIRTVATSSGPLKVPGVVPRLGTTPGRIDGGGPALGQHTDDVLRELGYDAARIAGLRARNVI